jgi:hypothetical protein
MTIELYIEGQRVELFKDESVTITDSIQNVKDIEKVFTAFTQSFSVPASKTNNKIFKHYYNFDIVEGFDARKKVTSTIELNSIPFRSGKIKLEGVDLKGNKPHTYRITFFGDIVDLKDKLGEKKLSDLNFSAYQPLNYNPATVETKLTTEESSSNHIIAPLITHSQRLFFNSDGSSEQPDDGNLKWFSGGGSHTHGVKWNELKYAIRVNKIIEQIEADLDLVFSSDFFKNTSLIEFDHLFLWLHRKSGAVEDLSGSTDLYETQVDGWTPSTSPSEFRMTTTTLTLDANINLDDDLLTLELRLVRTSTTPYNLKVFKDGEPIFSQANITDTTFIINSNDGDFGTGEADGDYTVFIEATQAVTFTDIEWDCRIEEPDPFDPDIEVEHHTFAYTTNADFTFNINRQMPDIKIIDFLTGLFKLFNLTAFVENDVIQVKPLDDFYSNPTTYDITEFVDVNSSKVDVALPYREIEFKFKDTKTFLANKFGELNNREWGSTRFSDGQTELAGQLYKVEAPFGHLLYERLVDPNDPVPPKNIQWGYNVDKSQNAYLGSPLLFYPVYTNTGGISFVDSVDENNVADDHKQITSVNLPSNTPAFNSSTNAHQLNYSLEENEYTGNSTFNKTLFQEYYSSYISDVFNTKQRLTKLKAYLPMRILLNYSLGDRFIVAGNQYKINSISTNLLTGESNIELLNDL